jgi:hypothetical protein
VDATSIHFLRHSFSFEKFASAICTSFYVGKNLIDYDDCKGKTFEEVENEYNEHKSFRKDGGDECLLNLYSVDGLVFHDRLSCHQN